MVTTKLAKIPRALRSTHRPRLSAYITLVLLFFLAIMIRPHVSLSGQDAQPCSVSLKFYTNEWGSSNNGIFRGSCLSGKPHGRGVITDFGDESNVLVKGTWNQGRYHGLMEFFESMDNLSDNPINRWTCQYDKGVPHGDLVGFDKQGRRCALLKYSHGKMVAETWYYPDGKVIRPAGQGTTYISEILSSVNSRFANLKKFARLDFAHRRSLTREQRIREILELQAALVAFEETYELIAEKGIRLYLPETITRGNLINMMHVNRINDQGRDWIYPRLNLKRHYDFSSMYISSYMYSWDNLIFTPLAKQPNKEAIARALRETALPRQVTEGLDVYLTPFSISDTNGVIYPSLMKMFLYGGADYKWAATESCVGHELGHLVQNQVLTKEEFKDYWEMRKVPPTADGTYAEPLEVGAEDMRVLYGGIDRATHRRNRPGRYGDIRDYPGKPEAIRKFMDSKIANFVKKYPSGRFKPYVIYHPDRYPWLYKAGGNEKLEIEITSRGDFLVNFFRYKPIAGGKDAMSTMQATYTWSRGMHAIPVRDLAEGVYTISISQVLRDRKLRNMGNTAFLVYQEK
ncbi:MAG TPA: hypothetical protein PKY31_08705 [Spirochaetota bacterium]|nr:hypothetical protein [Spirochaetota bacterium]